LKPELLLYSDFDSPRLQYILNWIFGEQLGITFGLTTDLIHWNNFEGAKINYSSYKYANEHLHIIPHSILKETDITPQNLSINRWKHSTILFYNQPGAKVPFDIFAAAFYLLSRYEEYLPNEKDKHGRYNPEQSVAAQYSFLQQPVVDEWIFHFGKILEQQFQLHLRKKEFQFIPTYDIDIAWKYLHKGSKRNLGGLVKDVVLLKWADVSERIAVNAGKNKDPFDCFEWLDSVHEKYQLHPIYFMLLGQPGAFDKNANPYSEAMQDLMKTLGKRYSMGIHPSYGSHKNAGILKAEIEILESNIQKSITQSRQHYIKFSLPETYEILISQGIQEDYSMGYASSNGFRAGTSNSFLWYNLKDENVTSLRVHPFAFMEATNKFYLKQNPQTAWEDLERLWHAVKKVNGTFISIWHNYILGTDKAGKGWRELYLKMLEQL
jgi:hypothetical protein